MLPKSKVRKIKTKSLPKCSFDQLFDEVHTWRPKRKLEPLKTNKQSMKKIENLRSVGSFKDYIIKQYSQLLQPEAGLFGTNTPMSPILLQRKLERLNPEAMKVIRSETNLTKISLGGAMNDSSHLESIIHDSLFSPNEAFSNKTHRRTESNKYDNLTPKYKDVPFLNKTLLGHTKNVVSSTNTLNTTGFSGITGKLHLNDDIREIEKNREELQKRFERIKKRTEEFYKKALQTYRFFLRVTNLQIPIC